LLFTAEIMHCWLEKHGGKAELTQGSIGEGVAKNYGVF